MIELGDPALTPVPAARRPGGIRKPLAAVTLGLLALLGGAVPHPRPPAVTVVAARLGESTFVERDRLHIVSGTGYQASGPRERTVSTYSLPGGRLLFRSTVALSGTVYQVTSSGRTLLVSYQVGTVGTEETTAAVMAGTRQELWRVPALLLTVSPDGASALLLHRAGNLPGDVTWLGLTLGTGQRRWSLTQPVAGYTTAAAYTGGFPRRLVTVTVDGHIEVHDTVTGRAVATADVPAPVEWSRRGVTAWPAGDLVLVGGAGGVTAYALSDLALRWTGALDLAGRWIQPDCAGAVCLIGYRAGIQVVDPVDGAPRWSSERWTSAVPVGPVLLVTGGGGMEARYPLAVVDPATGTLLADFGHWRVVSDVRPDVLVCRRTDASVAIWPL
ncbi:hypothetical protein [Actinoplanes sp. NPDC051494]|uniref:hypothetical protein n=1 Tax=Actinoplanes sp. NPDC051494 TaxID=3363907 RepID=UPI0037B6ECC4